MSDRGGSMGPPGRGGPGVRAAVPDGPPSPSASSSPSAAPIWWTDARNDPWRDPTTPTEIVLRPPPASSTPALEPLPEPERPADGQVRLVPVVVVTALLVGLVAGAVGGALGYRYGVHAPGATVLGAAPDAQPAAWAQRPPESLAAVVQQVLPSVVTIRAPGQSGTNLGSGFMISTDGHVITNDHVIGTGRVPPMVTFHDGQTVQARLVGRDPESDLAVLRVEGGEAPPVKLGDSALVAVGDPVLAFGSPLALANTVTSGIVSAVDRTISAGGPGEPGEQVRYYAAIQTDAAVNQGNSGGPLVDAAGRVIGVNSVIKSVAPNANEAGNIGLAFAIPIGQAKRIAQEIIDTGQARRTVIGAELDRTTPATGNGVRLRSVVAGGPADQAGLRAGDVLVRFDDQLLTESTDLIALIRKQPPGTTVTVQYRRNGAEASVRVTLVADGG